MALNMNALVVNIIVSSIIVAPVLWISGRSLVGKDKAKFSDAVWIVFLGVVVGSLLGSFFSGTIASIIQFILWLLLVRHFFDCGWVRAFVISFLAVIIFAGIVIMIGFLGFFAFSFF